MTVNRQNMLAWIEALESGEFRQAQHYLSIKQDDGTFHHCCLGVACQVALANGLDLPAREVTVSADRVRLLYGSGDAFSTTTLPAAVKGWLGLGDASAHVRLPDSSHVSTSAVNANDALGWDFSQIAAGLRRQYLEGFQP